MITSLITLVFYDFLVGKTDCWNMVAFQSCFSFSLLPPCYYHQSYCFSYQKYGYYHYYHHRYYLKLRHLYCYYYNIILIAVFVVVSNKVVVFVIIIMFTSIKLLVLFSCFWYFLSTMAIVGRLCASAFFVHSSYWVIHPPFISVNYSHPIAAEVFIVSLRTVNCIAKTIFQRIL